MGQKDKSWKSTIDRFKYNRRKIPRIHPDDVREMAQHPITTMSDTPLGLPQPPVERVEVTSVEFAQNVKSLTYLAISRLGCYNMATTHITRSSKAALERLVAHADEISNATENIKIIYICINL
eukprot:UN26168